MSLRAVILLYVYTTTIKIVNELKNPILNIGNFSLVVGCTKGLVLAIN